MPRDGARVLRGPADRGADERGVRLREGRSRGAPRRRRALHGGRAGHDRPRRLAAERLPDPRAAAVLRRHLLPAGVPPRDAGLERGAAGDRRALARALRGDPRRRRAAARAARRRRAARALRRAAAGGRPGHGHRAPARTLRHAQRRLRRGGRPQVPAGPGPRSSCSRQARGARDGSARRCARWPPEASTTRSAAAFTATRSTRPGPCRTSRRCSTTTPCSRARTCTASSSPTSPCCAGSANRPSTGRLREMRAPEGGFYSALDADSEGGEGSFYVWTLAELHSVLGADAEAAIAWFGATAKGNFRGESGREQALNVLEARGPEPPAEQRERIRARLLAAREQRPRPALDDKRLTSWNALMIAALADAGAVLEPSTAMTARSGVPGAATSRPRRPAPSSCCATCAPTRGRLLRTYSHGRATLDGYLEDYAFLLEALLALYEATFQERWFEAARALADELIARFARPRARRLLLDGRRPRSADRAPQGARGRADPRRRLLRGARAAAPRGAQRGAASYERQALGVAAPAARDRARATPPPSGTCCGRSTSTSPPRARSRSSDPPALRAHGAGARRARATAPPARAGGRRGRRARREASRCWPAAPRSTGTRRPTSASASPASARSPSPRSWPARSAHSGVQRAQIYRIDR